MRRALFALACVLALTTAHLYAALPGTENCSGGAWGGGWTVTQGGLNTDTGECHGNGSGTENTGYWSADAFNANHYAQATVKGTAGGANSGLMVRMSGSAGTTQGYLCAGGANGDAKIYKITSGTSYSDLITATGVAFAAADVMRCEASGTTITMKKNGATITSVSNGDIASGSAGVYLYSSGFHIDDIEVGDLGGGGGAACLGLLSMLGVGGC